MSPACVFCEIVAGARPARIVREWPDALAFVPLGPVVDGHTLVIPKVHVADFIADPDITGMTAKRAAELARDLDLVHANLITSRGVHATQSVTHLHFHLLPRTPGDGLALPWLPTSTVIGSVTGPLHTGTGTQVATYRQR